VRPANRLARNQGMHGSGNTRAQNGGSTPRPVIPVVTIHARPQRQRWMASRQRTKGTSGGGANVSRNGGRMRTWQARATMASEKAMANRGADDRPDGTAVGSGRGFRRTRARQGGGTLSRGVSLPRRPATPTSGGTCHTASPRGPRRKRSAFPPSAGPVGVHASGLPDPLCPWCEPLAAGR
jgi:hypothetical protein